MKTEKEVSVRRATLHDAEEILRCLEEAFAPYRDSYTPEAFTDTVCTEETVGRRFAEMRILVAADSSGYVLGTIAYKAESGEGHLRGMAVRPEWHGTGVAQRLLDQAESDLRELHCKTMTLDTTTPLRRAVRFYERNGFQATGEVTSFFGMDLFSYRKEI